MSTRQPFVKIGSMVNEGTMVYEGRGEFRQEATLECSALKVRNEHTYGIHMNDEKSTVSPSGTKRR